ncbi:Serine threonine- kinase CTR1 [Chlorella sorokiniana]|uniref:Serine threonine-kinase CTR1 n=1 Tax=Chlorella sorokiniana TaxID=3076 RepID=A0A2P6TNJ0_CHLSO|nr:Serine threonine- kinase CTR1 [Chlorella sorokiniana]|eukprot:PRW50898.1 Serine threonine- kinase CTR1 [Chlorella sorokiniana]
MDRHKAARIARLVQELKAIDEWGSSSQQARDVADALADLAADDQPAKAAIAAAGAVPALRLRGRGSSDMQDDVERALLNLADCRADNQAPQLRTPAQSSGADKIAAGLESELVLGRQPATPDQPHAGLSGPGGSGAPSPSASTGQHTTCRVMQRAGLRLGYIMAAAQASLPASTPQLDGLQQPGASCGNPVDSAVAAAAKAAQPVDGAQPAGSASRTLSGIAAKLGLDFGSGSQPADPAVPLSGSGAPGSAPPAADCNGPDGSGSSALGPAPSAIDCSGPNGGSSSAPGLAPPAAGCSGSDSGVGTKAAPAVSFTTLPSCSIVKWTDLKLNGSSAGSGAYGTVLLATLEETPVAAKVLVPLRQGPSGKEAAGSPTERQLQKFHRECSLLTSVRHPNIVQILSVCMDPPTIIMEYCARGSLLDVLKKACTSARQASVLSWQRRLCMALDAARGILHMHNRGIAHRDLKSPNLLVDAGMRVKVADFGFCKSFQGNAADNVMSTTLKNVNPKWQAPEVIFGGPATFASDAYAYGCILWELMTWDAPWSGVLPAVVYGYKMNGKQLELPSTPEALAQLPGTDKDRAAFARVAPQYIRVIQQCWAASEADRPAFATIIQQLTEIKECSSFKHRLPRVSSASRRENSGALKASKHSNSWHLPDALVHGERGVNPASELRKIRAA